MSPFPEIWWEGLSLIQQEQMRAFPRLLLELNRSVNLISREQRAEQVMERHVQHCLVLATRSFATGQVVADWGTGGGLPAIPLSICFPAVRFVAIDAVEKKIHAVRTMARRLGLGNLEAWHGRAEAYTGIIDHSVSRATAPLALLWQWHRQVAREVPGAGTTGEWPPGLICLKGGRLRDEIEALEQLENGLRVEQEPVERWLRDPYYADKVVVTVTRGGDGTRDAEEHRVAF